MLLQCTHMLTHTKHITRSLSKQDAKLVITNSDPLVSVDVDLCVRKRMWYKNASEIWPMDLAPDTIITMIK